MFTLDYIAGDTNGSMQFLAVYFLWKIAKVFRGINSSSWKIPEYFKLERHSVERMYLRQRCSHGSRWIKPFLNHASLQRRVPNTYTWDFPDVIKFHVAAHTISDRAQKLISSSMPQHLSAHNISAKSMHAFLSNLANRQTDRQTDTGKNICRR